MGNKPGYLGYVVLWSVAIGVGGSLIGSSVGLFLSFFVVQLMTNGQPTQSEIVLFTRYFTAIFFGLFFVVGFIRRSQRWERLNNEECN